MKEVVTVLLFLAIANSLGTALVLVATGLLVTSLVQEVMKG